MTKALIFDLDDTLLWDKKSVKESFQATCFEAFQKTNIAPEKLEQAVREKARTLYAHYPFYSFTQNIGINPFEGLWGDFLDIHDENFREMAKYVPEYRQKAWTEGLYECGVDDERLGHYLAERFPYHRRKLPFVFEETFDVLTTLHNQYELFLLTNGSPHLQHEKLEMTPQLVPYFKYILISGAFGKGKPHRSIFEHALSLLDVKPSEAMMIGDNLHTDIKGANAAGIPNVWIDHGKSYDEDIPYTYRISRLHDLLSLLNIK